MDRDGDQGAGAPTVFGLGRAQLLAVCDALALPVGRRERIASVYDGAVARCGDRPLALPPRWSGMTDDCSPIEVSVAFRRGDPDVRVLLEAQADPPSPLTYARAADELTAWLVADVGADDTLAVSLAPRFVPGPHAFLAAFHGIEFHHDGRIRTKLYRAPGATGDPWGTVRAVMADAGLDGPLADVVAEVGELDVPLIAVDLEPSATARLKLYLRSPDLDVLDRLCALGGTAGGHATRLAAALYGEPTVDRVPYVALHLAAAGPGGVARGPSRAVLSLPVIDASPAQQVVEERIAALLEDHGLDAAAYRRASAAAFASMPAEARGLDGPLGVHTWLSVQDEPDGSPRITVYFAVRAFAGRFGFPALDPTRTWPSPVTGLGPSV